MAGPDFFAARLDLFRRQMSAVRLDVIVTERGIEVHAHDSEAGDDPPLLIFTDMRPDDPEAT